MSETINDQPVELIGVTQRGDAGRDFYWSENYKEFKGIVLITKYCCDAFIDKVIEVYNSGYTNIAIHITCTGMGATIYEPHSYSITQQMDGIKKLIANGFPKENILLRVDPVFCTFDGLRKAMAVIDYALENIPELELKEVRISFLDMYPHVIRRFEAKRLPLPHKSFHAPMKSLQHAASVLTKFAKKRNIKFLLCGEPKKSYFNDSDVFEHRGCVSQFDLDKFGIENNLGKCKERHECTCCANKREMLVKNKKKQCANKCVYCFWK